MMYSKDILVLSPVQCGSAQKNPRHEHRAGNVVQSVWVRSKCSEIFNIKIIITFGLLSEIVPRESIMV